MPRPTFRLSDDQARAITSRVTQLQASFPLDARSHRPFVTGFLRAVYDATGQLYSPAIYHRLLAAFAPERKPSTTTLATEKDALSKLLALSAQAAASDAISNHGENDNNGNTGQRSTMLDTQLHDIVTAAVENAMLRGAAPTAFGAVQVEFYAARLSEAERELDALRSQCSAMSAQLTAALHERSKMESEVVAGREALIAQNRTSEKLVAEVSDIRKFALVAIDEARGEARVWKQRCVDLEDVRRAEARLLESFRRHAYRAGAAIPDELR